MIVPPDLKVDRRRADGARLGRDHNAGGEQDRPERQAAGLHRGRRAQGQGAQRHVHRDVGQGRLQRQAIIQGRMFHFLSRYYVALKVLHN